MCGIGTTLVEATRLGRDAVGVELEPRCADLARANLAHARAAGASGTGRVVTGDARGQGTAHEAFDLRIPRDGGITDLLAEAHQPGRRFDAVICESIDRIARRTYLGAKIEHELEQAGVALFAADEPILLSGKRATAILTRRVKQGVAEWYVLEMLEKSWDGACEHTRQGWNVGRPPYGYQAEPIPHPVPARRAEGKTKTRLRPDPVRAAVVRQIFAWRVTERLGYRAIAERLSQDRDRYPPPVSPDPARSRDCWGYSAVLEVLRNPKYTGYMVWNRRASKKGGRHNPPEAWVWSPRPTHQPIVSRELFAAAQHVAPQRRGSRSGAGLNRHPQTRRSYPLRSLVTCELCGRKMRGKVRRKSRRDYVYYACEPPRSLGRRVAAQRSPSIPPASWSARICCCAASWSSSRCACSAPNGGPCSPKTSPMSPVARSRHGRRGCRRSSEPSPTSRAARRAWFARSRSATTLAGPCSSRSLGGWETWTASTKPNWPSYGPWSPNGRKPMRRRSTCWICFPCSRPNDWLRRPNRCCAPCSSGSSCRSATTSHRSGRPSVSRSATTAWTACWLPSTTSRAKQRDKTQRSRPLERFPLLVEPPGGLHQQGKPARSRAAGQEVLTGEALETLGNRPRPGRFHGRGMIAPRRRWPAATRRARPIQHEQEPYSGTLVGGVVPWRLDAGFAGCPGAPHVGGGSPLPPGHPIPARSRPPRAV
jgi:DNA invertase Pin-like site-specific DNA recombinase